MDVKILSMQRVKNHGSFLQSYALKCTIERMGAFVSFYDIKKGEDNSPIVSSRQAEQKYNRRYNAIVQRILMRFCGKKQNHIFEAQLERYLGITNEEVTSGACDLAVIGSDEVFNCVLPSKWGFSEQLFGEIPEAKHVITYAASCGRTTSSALNDYFKEKIRKALLKTDAISVRDTNTFNFVREISGKTPVMHLDPVLIYDFSKETIECGFRKPFVLLYSYANRITNPVEIKAIKKFAKEKKLEIVCAGVFQYWCKYNIPVTSFELLGYFQKAEYVITDTFHGSIMAIKAHRQFCSIVRDSNSNKLVDLLAVLGLKSQMCQSIYQLESIIEKLIDYTVVERKIQAEMQKTIEYLQAQINVASKNVEV